MKEAALYDPREDGTVDCHLCSFRCHIKDGRRGICGVRENREGKLYTLVYGKVIARNIDPIEKKPLYHYLPGTSSYSVATAGCNFRCLHCQNYDISQMPKDHKRIIGEDTTPENIADEAARQRCATIAYTYTEPTIFYEFARDVMVLARDKGIRNVFVTNGYMTGECIDGLDGLLDAANVDVKSFSEDFYKKVCGAKLAPVLESIERMRAKGVWVEVTTLIIPGYNDSEEELRNIARWMAKTDKRMPWHISAFYPTYKLTDAPRTPASTLERALEIGYEEGVRYVYTGNIPGMKGENTLCHECKRTIIERTGFYVRNDLVKDSSCPFCGAEVDGVFA